MSSLADRMRAMSPRRASTLLMAVLLLAGALVWIVPFLTRGRGGPVAVAAPPPLNAAMTYVVRPGQRACMQDVTFEPRGHLAAFTIVAPPGR
jgi:hypothetical protein